MAIEGKKPAARKAVKPERGTGRRKADRPSNAGRCCRCERLRNQRGCPRPDLNQYSLSPFVPVAPDQRDVGRSRISRDVSENLSVRTWVRRHSPGPFFNREHDRGTERQASSGQRGSSLLHRERKVGHDEQRRFARLGPRGFIPRCWSRAIASQAALGLDFATWVAIASISAGDRQS